MHSPKVPVDSPKVVVAAGSVVVFALFFLSGISGLIYQVLWLRRLSLTFGVTVYAASTVLAAFMTRLAVGGVLANWFLQRRIRPLAAFGAAECFVGATALASRWLLDGLLQIRQPPLDLSFLKADVAAIVDDSEPSRQ